VDASEPEATTNSSGVAGLLRAVDFAARAHRDQRRKCETLPYINHPVRVACLLAEVGGIDDLEVLQAGLLHDTIEDTTVTEEELRERFGPRVASLVAEVSDDQDLPEDERKRIQRETIPTLSPEAKAIRIADKISNVEDLTDHPPPDWGVDRKRAYLEFATGVVEACRGTNARLETRFDEVRERLLRVLGDGAG